MKTEQAQEIYAINEATAQNGGPSAFILRISSGDTARIKEALVDNQISIGWARVKGLLDPSLTWEECRKKIKDVYCPEDKNERRAGSATGQVWLLFIKRMKEGDLVVVPHSDGFYVARVCGPAIYREDKISVDEAYRRDVVWLNDKKPIPRMWARSALISRMKTYNTCVLASDLLESIKECLDFAEKGEKPTFQADLQNRLVKATLEELRNGRVDPRRFEELIKSVMLGLGAREASVIPTILDKGADVLATFHVGGFISQKVAVQAKHYQSKPPVGADVVRQLIRGIEAEGANLGMVVTTGTIGEEAREEAQKYSEETGIAMELVDGEQFAKLIVENGIRLAA